ncbi:MAG: hypothetical protein AAF589_07745 [Planctomycetota bacterium]
MNEYASPYANVESKKSGPAVIWWVLGGIGALLFLGCGAIFAGLVYVGANSPDTSVYTANRIPKAYVDVMREVGGYGADEQVIFFYSDGFMDVREAFYYVSNQKVAVYYQDADPPLTTVRFDQIDDAEFLRDDSFLIDSQITLMLKDGSVVAFPVSSEFDRDQQFFDAIKQRMPAKE